MKSDQNQLLNILKEIIIKFFDKYFKNKKLMMQSNNLDLEKQYCKYAGILKNAQYGKVRTRFPPEPSGYLHIGHVKAVLLNYHYAKMYKGEMILRFDDTNPSKEKHQFVQAILEDLNTLGITYSKLSYTSDYFDVIINYARDLIKNGKAYVDNTDADTLRKQRQNRTQSLCRSFTPQKNLDIFDKMIKGEVLDYCLRAKIDMNSNNGALRDPVLGRSNQTPHQRTGKKYIFYPTYDFACPIVDHLEGITHTMRSIQFADRIPQYFWVLDALGFPRHEIYEYSRLNFEYTLMSKRKLQYFVDTGKVDGWNDPRLPTLRGVLRKGMCIEALIEFMLEQGPSKRSVLMQWDKLWAFNKKIIDPICPRYSAVRVDKACVMKIINISTDPQVTTVAKSRLNLDLGYRPLWKSSNLLIDFIDANNLMKINEKVTLINFGNVFIKSKEIQQNGSYLMTAEYLPDDRDYKTTPKITWLAEESNLLIVDVFEFDHLINQRTIYADCDLETIVNTNSKFSAKYYVDSNLRTLNVGQFIQFQRKGHYRIDKIEIKAGDSLYTLIKIPDGKQIGIDNGNSLINENSKIKRYTLKQKQIDKGKKKEDKLKQKNEGETKVQKNDKDVDENGPLSKNQPLLVDTDAMSKTDS